MSETTSDLGHVFRGSNVEPQGAVSLPMRTEDVAVLMKLCPKCKRQLPATESFFYKAPRKCSKSGWSCWCRTCTLREKHAYRQRNPTAETLGRKLWRAKNLDRVNACRRAQYQKKKEAGVLKKATPTPGQRAARAAACRAWRVLNAEKVRAEHEARKEARRFNRLKNGIKKRKRKYTDEQLAEHGREYRRTHREALKAQRDKYAALHPGHAATYARKRRAADPEFLLMGRLRCRMYGALRYTKRSDRYCALLGATIKELRCYLESKFKPGMTWENRRLWHIDHIRPCASFDLTDPEQQRQCFHYTNLQPLWATDNLKKHSLHQGRLHGRKVKKSDSVQVAKDP